MSKWRRFLPLIFTGLLCGLGASWLILRLRAQHEHAPATIAEQLAWSGQQKEFMSLREAIAQVDSTRTLGLVQRGITVSQGADALIRSVRARLGWADDVAFSMSGSDWVR
jgi:hypothetical protein